MRPEEILAQREHRPWSMPSGEWKYYQEWNRAIFLHWPVSFRHLRPFLPGALEIDEYDDNAWISLVAFTMEKIHPRSLMAVPAISDFHEINIRTYVKGEGKPGVYFLSIEGGKQLSCWIAKALSELPYRFSRIKRTQNTYQAKNTVFNDQFSIAFEHQEPISEKSELATWLTERYALFQENRKGKINAFEIHHPPWPLQAMEVTDLQIKYDRFSDLFAPRPALAHYSAGVPVLAWDKTQLLHT